MFLSVVDRHGNDVAYRHFIGSSDSLANVTYEKFYKLVLEASGGLCQLDIRGGDRVALL